MTRSAEILRLCVLRNAGKRCDGAFCRRNACCGRHMVDGNRKCCFVIIRILLYHLRNPQFPHIFLRHRHTNQTLAIACHEVDVFCGCKFCRADEIPFVLPIGIICYQNDFAVAQFLQRFLYCVKLHNVFPP